MEVTFIGVGEAFEPQLGNSSYLIQSESCLLVDCGYAVPANLFSTTDDPNVIDAIYITHFHADHTFGIPAVLNRWNEDDREKPLAIIGQHGVQKYLNEIIDLGYSSCRKRLKYEVRYIETVEDCVFNEWNFSFAKTDHGKSNYAIRITEGNVSLGISGDGGLTDDTRSLFQPCQYLIHEAFGFEEAMKGHTTAREVIEYAHTMPELKLLALVHLQRDERISRTTDYQKINESETFEVTIPSPGDVITLAG